MRRSKMEMYIDILKVLEGPRPLKLTHIMYETNVNCKVLNEYLGFLIKQDLVEERKIGEKRVAYSITQKGITVLKNFEELKQILPIIEDTTDLVPPPVEFPNATNP